MHRWRRSQDQGGWTLVELLVATALGLITVAAAWASYTSSVTMARGSLAMAQVAEDSDTVVRLLRRQIAMAGFSWPTVAPASGPVLHVLPATLLSVRGCDGGFAHPGAPALGTTASSLMPAKDTAGPDCTSTDGPDAIALRFQTDATSAYPDAAGNPTDCLGRGLVAVPASASAPAHFVADQRFYVREGAFLCTGNGGVAVGDDLLPGQPLAEGVVDLQFTYGLSAALTEPGVHPVSSYVDARGVSAASAWPRVVAVRLCLIMASASDHVVSEPAAYLNCEGVAVMPPDRRLYRVTVATVALPSRMGPRRPP